MSKIVSLIHWYQALPRAEKPVATTFLLLTIAANMDCASRLAVAIFAGSNDIARRDMSATARLQPTDRHENIECLHRGNGDDANDQI